MARIKPISVICVLLVYVLTSCHIDRRITYFRDVPDSIFVQSKNINAAAYQDPQIKTADLLQISILTLDPQANSVLTTANSSTFAVQPGSSQAPGQLTNVSGFLVDNNGAVELPVIGKVKVAGMTTSEARDTIHNRVAVFYKDPVVNVRFANFNITVLGEVARPASYVVPSEKVSIVDAIGMAGDLTIFGKRDNVLLVRDSGNQKQMIRFNLNSAETFRSPYFYLKQGDVVYVEPAKSKAASTDAARTRNLTILGAGLSLLVVIFSSIR
jgi:polysaccharide export outer membrane protein